MIRFQDDPGTVLLASREKHFAALRQSDDGQAIARLEDAYLALTGEPAPPLVWAEPTAQVSGPNPAVQAAAQRHIEGKLTLPPPRKRSVRWKAQTLFDEADRVWNYDEIFAEWERRGDPIDAADPRGALRTAVWGMINAGLAVKVGHDGYKSSKFAATTKEVP